MEGPTISSAVTIQGAPAEIILKKQLDLRLNDNKIRNYGQVISLLLMELVDLQKDKASDNQ